MNTDLISLITVTGILLFIYNYMIGWIAGLKLANISKLHHQAAYILLIINLLFLLYLLNFLSNKFLLYFLSLLLLLILSYGTKGGVFHKVVSTSAILVYVFTMLNYQYFNLIG
ncbi:MAG TPA: hypothetical protein PK605_03930 [Ignavibacteria bacterium]|nr:hypothetical protein [Ignavibacteria bacterium]HRF64670.1 hypothetical protein [Ignavibacteria bacterium]HRJ03535.1 hypothetical protein [Ignavibacteria bacterium]HRJ84119.1 hypothetical protein [Ignavibacteria bacterium]